MVKPNISELETFLERRLHSLDEIKEAAQGIVDRGISVVLVSLGKDGAVIVTKEGAKLAKGLKVDVKNTVGAGDTMAAGAVKGLIHSGDAGEVLRQAAAAATCSIMQEGTGLADASMLQSVYNNIQITEI